MVKTRLVAKTDSHFVSRSVSSRLFTKLVLEAPVITESALEVIRRYCEDEVSDSEDTASPVCPLGCRADVTFVSVSGVFGHDDSEGAHHQTALEAVPVPACTSGSQLA